jgi:hypothetical protein
MSRDLICPVCGEEWDLDVIHEEAAVRAQTGPRPSFTTVLRQFQHSGCGVALAGSCGPLTCVPDESTADLANIARAMYDLLGDDIDGAINEIEDYRLMHGH